MAPEKKTGAKKCISESKAAASILNSHKKRRKRTMTFNINYMDMDEKCKANKH